MSSQHLIVRYQGEPPTPMRNQPRITIHMHLESAQALPKERTKYSPPLAPSLGEAF